MSNEHLLIIDDNHSLITILERLLLPLGYQVSQAFDGPQGLAMALDLKPDLLLLDMYMPHMTGLQLLRQLREKQFAAPVIFMTAQSSETIVIEAFRLGVTDYLIKPFQVDDLLRTVDNALLSTRLNQEKKQLTRALEQAETVRQTVATLSHYINNSLVAASCGLDLLYEMAFQLSDTRQGERLTDIFVSSRASLERIEAVLRAMQRLNSVNLVDHESGVVTIALEDLLQSVEGETAVFSPLSLPD